MYIPLLNSTPDLSWINLWPWWWMCANTSTRFPGLPGTTLSWWPWLPKFLPRSDPIFGTDRRSASDSATRRMRCMNSSTWLGHLSTTITWGRKGRLHHQTHHWSPAPSTTCWQQGWFVPGRTWSLTFRWQRSRPLVGHITSQKFTLIPRIMLPTAP